MNITLSQLIFAAGIGQLSVLAASALVPSQLRWRDELRSLPRLLRQLYWVYGGYVVLSIIALGLLCILNAQELSAGTGLGRSVCLFIAAFWGIRLTLQAILDVRGRLTKWWLKAGYHSLTALFVCFTLLFAYAALH